MFTKTVPVQVGCLSLNDDPEIGELTTGEGAETTPAKDGEAPKEDKGKESSGEKKSTPEKKPAEKK